MRVWLSPADIFDLYCTELGKPHNLIVWYQKSGWIDVEVLQWVAYNSTLKPLNIDFPRYLEFATDEFEGRYHYLVN